MKILVIKHGSLGDIVFSLPAMLSISNYYSNSKIDLLTEKKYFNFIKPSNYFSKLIEDNRSSNFFSTCLLLNKLLKNNYNIIIDLQNSSRTSYYNFFFRLFSKAKISSSRSFANYRYIIPLQGTETTSQGLFNQLKILNIHQYEKISFNWLEVNLDKIFNDKIILLIPSVSLKGKYKQWSPKKFISVAKYLQKNNYKICIIGTSSDNQTLLPIVKSNINIINMIDKSPPSIIFSIAKKAKLVITNDTGPGHIAALSGANILWILNKNKISRANIEDKFSNHKILSNNLNEITSGQVINYIDKNNLI